MLSSSFENVKERYLVLATLDRREMSDFGLIMHALEIEHLYAAGLDELKGAPLAKSYDEKQEIRVYEYAVAMVAHLYVTVRMEIIARGVTFDAETEVKLWEEGLIQARPLDI